MADSRPEALVAPASPANRVLTRFFRARGARLGLYLVIAFSLVAFFAPFLAHRLPMVWRDGATGAVTWPLFREFFAPSDTTEPMLERGINFLLLFLPVAYLAWRLMGSYWPGLGRARSRLIALLFGALVAAALWLAIGGMVMDGGGRDWLHEESPPVPEVDDIASPLAFDPEAPLAADLRALGLEWNPAGDDDLQRRLLIAPLQSLIEGPRLQPPSGFDPLDITEANIDLGINLPRWNRMVVEQAFPGLLTPMRRVRTTFLLMAAVSFLVLVGLTYICLAGAWQFSLSPRWLVLLVLAVLLAQAFRLPVRHDHTPYRAMAAAGEGWGVFPLIPYGPNEQGFGPRLPPSWYAESPSITAATIASWPALQRHLAAPETPGQQAVSEYVVLRDPQWQDATGTGLPGRIAGILNELVNGESLYGQEGLSVRPDMNTSAYIAALQGGNALDHEDTRRFNRLILERTLPGALVPAAAARWKKPNHAPGLHLLGTDESGRDVLVRMIHGARVSLSVGFVSVFLATVIGLVLGSLAAYYGGRVDMIISRFLEIMMCFPSFFLILAVIAVLDRRSIVNIMLVIGLTSWTGVARLVRGEMLRQKKMDYVSASIALGASDTRTIFRHILPNAMAPVLVSISFGITGAILTEAGLSFIGFGVTPPTPTWGQLLSETRDSPLANWWLAVFPGVVLFISVLAYNLVGEALRDALDPRTTV
ncbi:MAG: ABC transporter permease [Planctomycetaceae bacterium]|nr:ABC transporter permease [Planctomycetaceae bacterium]